MRWVTGRHSDGERGDSSPLWGGATRRATAGESAHSREAALRGRGLILWLALLLVCPVLRADDSAAFDAAARLYAQGKFREAAEAYGKLLQSGQLTAAVLFNQGNAWLQAEQIGHAIAAYRQARRVAPRDPDIVQNLHAARQKVQGAPPVNESLVGAVLRKVSLNEWAIGASAALWLLSAVLIAREVSSGLRRKLRPLAWLAGTAAALAWACLLAAAWLQRGEAAIVTVPEAVARYGPLEESQSAFTLGDGAETRVRDRKGEWLQLEDGAGRKGWVNIAQVQVLP